MAFVLAIDQGTTNSKALLLDETGRIVKRASAPVGVSYPQPGWVEQSAIDIWRSVQTVSTECLAAAEGKAVAAIGISNQRESVLVWDRRTGEPIGPSITWQCRRSAARIAGLRTPAVEQRVRAITGLGLDPLFPAAKIGWLLNAYPDARTLAARGHLCAGTIDSWLVFKLTGGKLHATDFGNASRTQLFDIGAGAWRPELLALFDVPPAIMAEARSSNGDFGITDIASSLPAGIPIRAVMGDSHAALFGHGIRKPGAVKATYGTGSSLMTLTDGPVTSRSGLSTTIAWRAGSPATPRAL
jgi:glycerol kinase